jgi:hypothetical protein
MTDLCPEHEATNSPALPYLFHCPSCDAEHVAIGFEKPQIEWVRDLIDESNRFHEYSLKKDKEGKKDAEEIRWHEGEIKVSEHILRDVIEPGLREFAQIKKVSTAEKRKGNETT